MTQPLLALIVPFDGETALEVLARCRQRLGTEAATVQLLPWQRGSVGGEARTAWRALTSALSASWVGWWDDREPGPIDSLRRLAARSTASDALFVTAPEAKSRNPWAASLVRTEALQRAKQTPPSLPDSAHEAEIVLWHTLLHEGGTLTSAVQALIGGEIPEPAVASWRAAATYEDTPLAWARILVEAATLGGGAAPGWLQRAVAQRLRWYFTVDAASARPPGDLLLLERQPSTRPCARPCGTCTWRQSRH